MLRLLTFLLCSLFAPVPAEGQESQGRIKGAVKDSDGAAVSGVDVSLLLSNRAVARATVTDASGNFTVLAKDLNGDLAADIVVHLNNGDHTAFDNVLLPTGAVRR